MKILHLIRKTCLLILLLGLSFNGFTQNSSQTSEIKLNVSDDLKAECTKRHPVAMLAGVGLPLLAVHSFNRFISDSTMAKVTGGDVVHFYERDFFWDRDWWWTNFVLHPYQGSLAYMSARSSGFSPLGSFLASTVSSTLWEWFGEKTTPSMNDMIYTPLGSVAVGEMFLRLSQEASGAGSRLGGYVLSPSRLITEPIMGHRLNGTRGNIYAMDIKYSMGACSQTVISESSTIMSDKDKEVLPIFFSPEIDIVYNDPYGHDSNTPYSQFNFVFMFAAGAGSGKSDKNCNYSTFEKAVGYDLSICSEGMLFSRAPVIRDDIDTTVGLALLYDFRWNNIVEFSSIGPAFAFKQRYNHADNSTFEWQWYAGWTALGSSDYYYFRRNYILPQDGVGNVYNYNTGFQNLLMLRWQTPKGHMFMIDSHFYALYAFEHQIQDNGSTGWDFLQLVRFDYCLPITEKFSFGLKNELFVKESVTEKYPTYWQIIDDAALYVKINLRNR